MIKFVEKIFKLVNRKELANKLYNAVICGQQTLE